MRFNKDINKHFQFIFFQDYVKSMKENLDFRHTEYKDYDTVADRFYHKSGAFYIALYPLNRQNNPSSYDIRYMHMDVVFDSLVLNPVFERESWPFKICEFINIPRRKEWTPQEIQQQKDELKKKLELAEERERQRVQRATVAQLQKIANEISGKANRGVYLPSSFMDEELPF